MKKARKAKATRRLGIENLERREVLAGNVAVTLTSGFLTVTGDGAANHITIYQQDNGRFNIAGIDDEVFTGPTTNLLVRNIYVNLQGGDDSVVIAAQPTAERPGDMLPAVVLGATTVLGGSGADAVTIAVVGRQAGTRILPSLAVTVDTGIQASGMQNDVVAIFNTATSALTINTWGGQDTVDIQNLLALSTIVNTGDGADDVTITEAASVTASVNLGSSSTINANVIMVDTGLFGTLSVTGGNGLDDVSISNTLVGLSLNVFTTGGNDTVALDTVQTGLTQLDIQQLASDLIAAFDLDISLLPFDYSALLARLPGVPGYLSIFTGEGNDVVTMNEVYSTFIMYVYLEGGNDQLTATEVESKWAFFNGGLGTDDRFLDAVDAILSVLLFEGFLPDPDEGDLGSA